MKNIDPDFFERKRKVLNYDIKYIKPFIQVCYPDFTDFRKLYNFKHLPSYNIDILLMLEDVIERIEIMKKLDDVTIREQVKVIVFKE
jgi:hypothetical protein